MQSRHRIPTIFNLSMVDVLCCALGCIILLWLVYFKEAREKAIAAGQTSKQLTATKTKLDEVLRDLTSARETLLAGKQKNEHLSGQLLEVSNQRDQVLAKWEKTDSDHQATLQNLKNAQATATGLQKDLKDLQTLHATLNAILAQKNRENGDLATQLLAANQNIGNLEKMVGAQKGSLAVTEAHSAELKAKLADAEKNATTLEQQLASSKTLAKEYAAQLAKIESKAMMLDSELGKRKLDLAESGKRYEDLLAFKNLLEQSLIASKLDNAKREKDLSAAKGDLAKSAADLLALKNDLAKHAKELDQSRLTNHGLAGETKVLGQEIDKLRAAAENRFAGIELTGARVLFLVDMSGSMRMKDDKTEDPDKWPLVCEILGKIMKSLPDLKQFQVILFSDKIRYPLANPGKWLDYHGPASVKNAIESVRAEVPENETNMSAVFEEAFKYRAQGLDTIYLLSDGLPNAGAGLPAGAEKLPATEQSVLLGKYVRDRLKTTWNNPRGTGPNQRVRINAVGFFFDSPDVGAFLWALARDNDGSFVGLSKP